MKAKVTMTNVISYIIGNLRYKIYYSSWFSFLMRKHIKEQIDFRIDHMEIECYNSGSCQMCGCSTTALQMANKSCHKPCYPEMMDADEWESFSKYGIGFRDKNGFWYLHSVTRALFLNHKIQCYVGKK